MMQTIYQIYKEKYPRRKRLKILKEFSSMDINKTKFTIKNKIVKVFWLQRHPFISDFTLSILSIFSI